MAKTGNKNASTQANIDRLNREKANVVKELEGLKLKHNQTTAENKGLKEAVDSMKAELASKDTYSIEKSGKQIHQCEKQAESS